MILALFACVPSEPTEAQGTPANAAPSAECTRAVEEFEGLFKHAPDFDEVIRPHVIPEVQLAESRGGQPYMDALPIAVLQDGGFAIGAKRLADLAALRKELEALIDQERRLLDAQGREFGMAFALAADARASARVIGEVARILPRGVNLLLLTELAGDEPPPPPPLTPELQAMRAARVDRGDALQALGSRLGSAIAGCPPLVECFDASAKRAPDARSREFAACTPRALTACRCEGVDLGTFLGGAWMLFGKWAPSWRLHFLEIETRATFDPIRLPRDATVRDLVPHLEKRGPMPFRLVFEP